MKETLLKLTMALFVLNLFGPLASAQDHGTETPGTTTDSGSSNGESQRPLATGDPQPASSDSLKYLYEKRKKELDTAEKELTKLEESFKHANRLRNGYYFVVIPALVITGGYLGYRLGQSLNIYSETGRWPARTRRDLITLFATSIAGDVIGFYSRGKAEELEKQVALAKTKIAQQKKYLAELQNETK